PRQRHGLRKRAVRMHVDRLHAAAVHHDLPAPGGRALRMDMRGSEEIATDESGAGHGACAADEVSARGHVVLPFAGDLSRIVRLNRLLCAASADRTVSARPWPLRCARSAEETATKR